MKIYTTKAVRYNWLYQNGEVNEPILFKVISSSKNDLLISSVFTHHHQDVLTADSFDPYQTPLEVTPLDGIQCLDRTDESKPLLVGQHWYVHVQQSIAECCLWGCLYLTSSAHHVLLIDSK